MTSIPGAATVMTIVICCGTFFVIAQSVVYFPNIEVHP
jgi:hypothetical protein